MSSEKRIQKFTAALLSNLDREGHPSVRSVVAALADSGTVLASVRPKVKPRPRKVRCDQRRTREETNDG